MQDKLTIISCLQLHAPNISKSMKMSRFILFFFWILQTNPQPRFRLCLQGKDMQVSNRFLFVNWETFNMGHICACIVQLLTNVGLFFSFLAHGFFDQLYMIYILRQLYEHLKISSKIISVQRNTAMIHYSTVQSVLRLKFCYRDTYVSLIAVAYKPDL